MGTYLKYLSPPKESSMAGVHATDDLIAQDPVPVHAFAKSRHSFFRPAWPLAMFVV
jgi:hypothetical protein